MMTYAELIKSMLKNGKEMSPVEISKKIIQKRKLTGNVAYYLPGGIATLLRQMNARKEVKLSKRKTPRGGKMYKL